MAVSQLEHSVSENNKADGAGEDVHIVSAKDGGVDKHIAKGREAILGGVVGGHVDDGVNV